VLVTLDQPPVIDRTPTTCGTAPKGTHGDADSTIDGAGLDDAMPAADAVGVDELPKLGLADGHGGHGLADDVKVGAGLGVGLSEPIAMALADAEAENVGSGLMLGHGAQDSDGEGDSNEVAEDVAVAVAEVTGLPELLSVANALGEPDSIGLAVGHGWQGFSIAMADGRAEPVTAVEPGDPLASPEADAEATVLSVGSGAMDSLAQGAGEKAVGAALDVGHGSPIGAGVAIVDAEAPALADAPADALLAGGDEMGSEAAHVAVAVGIAEAVSLGEPVALADAATDGVDDDVAPMTALLGDGLEPVEHATTKRATAANTATAGTARRDRTTMEVLQCTHSPGMPNQAPGAGSDATPRHERPTRRPTVARESPRSCVAGRMPALPRPCSWQRRRRSSCEAGRHVGTTLTNKAMVLQCEDRHRSTPPKRGTGATRQSGKEL